MNNRFTVNYRICAKNIAEAKQKANDICVEQTVEFPPEFITKEYIKNTLLGRIVSLEPSKKGLFTASISYANDSAGSEITQLLNVIFGNTSIKPGIRVEDLNFSPALLKKYNGPRFGVEGVRKILSVYNRPLLCSALKPMGLTPKELAALASKFTLGGLDMIKDDHGLADQKFSHFKERVARCSDAVSTSEKLTKTRCLYAPNITADGDETIKRARFAKKAGAGALVISPGLCGFGSVRQIADDASINLPILLHPAFLGAFTANPQNGISHAALYGQIARLCGADAAIFTNFKGRFSFSREECASIAEKTRNKMGNIKKIFPAPGGGMQLSTVKEMTKFYGKDVLFLMGGGLFSAGPDLLENCLKFRELVSR